MPIVGLIAFLIGVVLAYQGSTQLQRFGAEIFLVNLVAVAVLREMGIMLTAIVVAGRSGSAFTAHIGSMTANEEVDALRPLGLDPVEILVLPRVLALAIAMPLLAFFADIMGLLGGGVMAWAALGISPGVYIERLNAAVGLWAFWIGIIKAPAFGILIALVSCNEGLQVVALDVNAVRRHQRNQRLAQTARRLRPEISHAPLPSHETATHRRPILWSQETINDAAAETRPRRPPTSSSRGQERGTWVVTIRGGTIMSNITIGLIPLNPV